MNNLLSPSFLISSIGTLLLGVWVLRKEPRNRVYFSWFLFCLSVSLWSLGLGVLTLVKSKTLANIFYAIHYFGAINIPASFLYFVRVYFLKDVKIRKDIQAGIALSVIQILMFFGGLLVEPLTPKWKFLHYTNPGPFYPLFMAYFFTYVVLGFYFMLRSTLPDFTAERKRKIFFILATSFGYVGGSSAFLLVYDIAVPPYGIFLFLLFPMITTYTIIAFRFLDIQVVVRRTVVFAGLLAFVFSVFAGATFFVQGVLMRFGLGREWRYGISLFIIVLAFDPIRNFLVNLTDKYLFQKKYDYQKILKDATRGMSKIESLQHLLALVVHFVTMKMRVKNAAIMMRRKDNELELGFQRGYEKAFLEYRLDDTNPLIMYLKKEKESIDVERVREYIEAGNKKRVKGEKRPHEYDFHAILLTMQELSAACAIPSFLGRELQSVLLLGEKKSGDYYTAEDLNVLFTLAQESAIAIENAKLFDEAIAKTNQLTKINEQLEYSRSLLMKALRETEVANKQLQDTQAQLIHEQKMATLGRLAASVGHEVNNPLTILSMNVSRAILKYRKNPDLKVGEILELFQKMEQNIGRIKAVVNTLTGLLKKSEKGKFEPLSLKLILEETLPLVQFQTYLDNLSGTEVDFDIPGSIPLVRGDLERLQEVFLNLFINAYHAMAGRRNRRIRVTAEIDPENNKNLAIHFTDNGSGMAEEVMRKIFNYGFTTKPPGKGSGMGLYMCKYIIELHGGDIKVSSKIGEGTTFTITLPIHEESSGESGMPPLKAYN
jgi:signal transduction histidine kinase